MAIFTNQATLIYNGQSTSSNVTTGEILNGISLTKTAISARQTPITTGNNGVEEIKQFKELLDAGIITEEEFAIKKRQLLGL